MPTALLIIQSLPAITARPRCAQSNSSLLTILQNQIPCHSWDLPVHVIHSFPLLGLPIQIHCTPAIQRSNSQTPSKNTPLRFYLTNLSGNRTHPGSQNKSKTAPYSVSPHSNVVTKPWPAAHTNTGGLIYHHYTVGSSCMPAGYI